VEWVSIALIRLGIFCLGVSLLLLGMFVPMAGLEDMRCFIDGMG
jgi:hypothetical protein